MIVYLDTSSLAKLYITEAGSDAVQALVQQAAVVATSQLAYPELRAALARRRRERTLRPGDFVAVKEAFEADWPRYAVTDVTRGICREAGDLAERHRLRGYDSVHLASFADVVRSARGAEVRFSSFDATLNRAARALARRLKAEG